MVRRVMMMKSLLQRWVPGLAILACAAGVALAQAFAPLEIADDLAAAGRLSAQRGAPIMLVFTLPDCPYCARARKDHLEPLRASPVYGAKVIIREIEAGNQRGSLRDFEGKATTHGDFARRYEVRHVPTVVVVDAQGKPLADPIVGLTLPDFYSLYLEQAIDRARLQLRTRAAP